MVIVTLQRDKCIGCNYCAEFAPNHFRMSKKDGKSVLLKSTNKKGFHSVLLWFIALVLKYHIDFIEPEVENYIALETLIERIIKSKYSFDRLSH